MKTYLWSRSSIVTFSGVSLTIILLWEFSIVWDWVIVWEIRVTLFLTNAVASKTDSQQEGKGVTGKHLAIKLTTETNIVVTIHYHKPNQML